MFNPIRAKSRIVALGNHKDCIWTKSDKYAPILQPDSMPLITSVAAEKCRTLKQGDCKTAFCQTILPDNKILIIKPLIGNPDAKKDEYWLLTQTLHCSPWHWYMKMKSILKQIGLQENASDPCLFMVTSLIHIILLTHRLHHPSHWVSMLTILYITSPRIPRLNASLKPSFPCSLPSSSWERWNGFLAHTSNGLP